MSSKQKSFFWLFTVLFTVTCIYLNYERAKTSYMIRSDGSGYYAYLPSLFLYDSDYLKSAKVEQKNHGTEQLAPTYLYYGKNHRVINKYYPGVSLIQLPAFGGAVLFSWLSGLPIDGYSPVFQFFFLLGSIFYTLLGVYYLLLIANKMKLSGVKTVLICFLTTPLFFYSIDAPSFSHHYSFTFFTIFIYHLLFQLEKPNLKRTIILALLLSVLVLIRPTNILILLVIPFLCGSWKDFMKLFRWQLQVKQLGLFSLSFFTVLSLLLIISKIQTGSWVNWSYKGEGFDFSSPKIWQHWFSFRVGLFVHTPIFLLSLIVLWVDKSFTFFEKYSWSIFLIVVTFVLSSWWCWDYSTSFGNRPYTEFTFILLLPLFRSAFAGKKVISVLIVSFLVLNTIRFVQYQSGFINTTRSTASSYFTSFVFWKKENKGRWEFNRFCEPHGEETTRRKLNFSSNSYNFNAKVEFECLAKYSFLKPRNGERYHYRFEVDKFMESNSLEDVLLVVDKFDGAKRFSDSRPLYSDKFEAKNQWEHLIIDDNIYDNFEVFDSVAFYVWNKGHKQFSLKNISLTVSSYKSQ
jgi:hypothetical protein